MERQVFEEQVDRDGDGFLDFEEIGLWLTPSMEEIINNEVIT